MDLTPNAEGELYYEWRQESSPYHVDLSVAVVDQLSHDIGSASQDGHEIGGVLLGYYIPGNTPTVRIHDYELIMSDDDNAGLYRIGSRNQGRFSETKNRIAITHGSTPVGIVRSHKRGGPLVLSNDDQQLLEREYSEGVHVAILVRAEEPRRAGLFVQAGTMPAAQLSLLEFAFDAEILRRSARAHIKPESATAHLDAVEHTFVPPPASLEFHDERSSVHDNGIRTASSSDLIAWIAGTLLVGLAFIAGLIARPLLPGTELDALLPGPSQIDLRVSAREGLLEIAWNQRLPQLQTINGAKLDVVDGSSTRHIDISRTELLAGKILYERSSEKVAVTLSLESPDGSELSQKADWSSSQ